MQTRGANYLKSLETMKTRRILALLSGALSTGAGAIHLQKRTDGAPRVVAFPIEHKLNHVSKPSYPLQGRGIVDATLDNVVSLKSITILRKQLTTTDNVLLCQHNNRYTPTEYTCQSKYWKK